MLALIKKEIKSYLSHQLVFILAAAFSVLSGVIFLNLLGQYFHLGEMPNAAEVDPIMFVIIGFFNNVNFVLIFLVPLICMNLFTKEYSQGTIVLLLTSRLTRWELVISKYLSAFVPILLCLSPLVVYLIIFWFSGLYEKSYLLAGALGIFCNLLIYTSIGVFLSNLFIKSPIIVAFTHAVILVLLNSIQSFAQFTDNYVIHKLLLYLSIVPHYVNLLRGLVNSSDLTYYFVFSFVFLFMSHKLFQIREA